MKPPPIIGEDGITRVWVENALEDQVRAINGHAVAVIDTASQAPQSIIFHNAVRGRPAGREDLTPEETQELLQMGALHATPHYRFLEQRGYVGIYVPEDQLTPDSP